MLKKTEKTEEQRKQDKICLIVFCISWLISALGVLVSFIKAGII